MDPFREENLVPRFAHVIPPELHEDLISFLDGQRLVVDEHYGLLSTEFGPGTGTDLTITMVAMPQKQRWGFYNLHMDFHTDRSMTNRINPYQVQLQLLDTFALPVHSQVVDDGIRFFNLAVLEPYRFSMGLQIPFKNVPPSAALKAESDWPH